MARCLRKNPARRFQHMADVKVALEELREELESGKLSAPAPVVVSAPSRRWPWIALAACGFTAAAIAIWKHLLRANLASRRIAVVVLSAIEWHIIRHSLSVIQGVVEASSPGSYQTVECGMFNRKPPVTLD